MGGPGLAVAGGPVAGGESSVPVQDRDGCDEKATSTMAGETMAGESSGEGGDQCSVGPVHPGSRGAAVQYGELVAQCEDLDVLGRGGAGE